MRVIDCINASKDTAFSFEVLPPIKGNGTGNLFRSIDRMMEFNPMYINITTHHSENIYVDLGDGTFKRSSIRRRPGSCCNSYSSSLRRSCCAAYSMQWIHTGRDRICAHRPAIIGNYRYSGATRRQSKGG